MKLSKNFTMEELCRSATAERHGIRNWPATEDEFLGTDGHGFLKRHGWLRDGKGFICIKAILKYRHGSFPQSKLSRELAKQAVITKCCGYIHAEPSRVF